MSPACMGSVADVVFPASGAGFFQSSENPRFLELLFDAKRRDADGVDVMIENLLVDECHLALDALRTSRPRRTLEQGDRPPQICDISGSARRDDSDRLFGTLRALGLPSAVVPRPGFALPEILKSADTVNVSSDTTVRPFDIDKLSIASSSFTLVDIATLLDGDDRDIVLDPHSHIRLPAEEEPTDLDDEVPYFDPFLTLRLGWTSFFAFFGIAVFWCGSPIGPVPSACSLCGRRATCCGWSSTVAAPIGFAEYHRARRCPLLDPSLTSERHGLE